MKKKWVLVMSVGMFSFLMYAQSPLEQRQESSIRSKTGTVGNPQSEDLSKMFNGAKVIPYNQLDVTLQERKDVELLPEKRTKEQKIKPQKVSSKGKLVFGGDNFKNNQPDTTTSDSSRRFFLWPSIELLGFSKPGSFNAHWSGIEFGLNTLLNKDYSLYAQDGYDDFMKLKIAQSFTFSLNLAEVNYAFNKRKNFGLFVGFGLMYYNYQFYHNETIQNNVITKRVEPVHIDAAHLDGNKLSVLYICVPLMIEYQYKNGFYVSGGFVANFLSDYHTKIVADGEVKKSDSSKPIYLSSNKLSAETKVGYRFLSLSVKYDLTPLYQKNKGPQMQSFGVGVGITF